MSNNFKSILQFGDNLDILKQLVDEYGQKGILDLIYIDPPFNSKAQYNILFRKNTDSKKQTAQEIAFSDIWSNRYQESLYPILEIDNGKYRNLYSVLNILAETKTVPDSGINYLSYMALRIIYMYKLLKDTGSFYLHCDPTMSHYLKVVLDGVFGSVNYRNEIVWERTKGSKGSQHKAKRYGNNIDAIFFYTKSQDYTFELDRIFEPISEEELIKKYPYTDERGRYFKGPIECDAGMGPRPNLCYEYKGYTNRFPSGWRMSKAKLIKLDEKGDLGWSKSGLPFRKFRMEDNRGKFVANLWNDLPYKTKSENLGYPTQKPIALLERIIQASSNEGDIVADFFCGCGTSIYTANKLKRKFIGCDISHLSISLIKNNLVKNGFKDTFIVKGLPSSVDGAYEYFCNNKNDFNENRVSNERRYEFERYVITYLLKGICTKIKSSQDRLHDGYVSFDFGLDNDENHICYIECKSGGISKVDIGSFANDIKVWQNTENHKNTIGLIVGFERFIGNDRKNLINSCYSENNQIIYFKNTKIPMIEILSIEDLLNGIIPKFLTIGNNNSYGNENKQLIL